MIELRAIEWMAARGWPLLLIKPRSKVPLTSHGVKDASVDLDVIAAGLRRCPDANLAVACGAPGPQVLDIDDVRAVPTRLLTQAHVAPRVATPRAGHSYFEGTDSGTVNLGWGELRGRGSYVLVPPSIHPSGKQYVWLSEPRGPLPAVPALLARGGQRAGCGAHEPPPRPIVAGEGRHLYVKDIAIRLARVGLLDRGDVAALLRCMFERHCEPLPPPTPGYFEQWAKWTVEQSQIAEHDRARSARPAFQLDERWWAS